MRELKAHEQILAIFRENNILHYLSTHNYIAPDLENAVHSTPLAADVEAMKAGAHDVVSLKHDEGAVADQISNRRVVMFVVRNTKRRLYD